MGILNKKSATSLRKTKEKQIHERVDEKLYKLLTKDRGFYVEVGAGDGITDSPTLLLENYGWQGILIESNIESCAHCKINRPKAAVLNYECVTSDHSDERVEEEKARQENKLRDTKGNASTLTAILEEFEVKEFDLLVLNLNGHVLNVLKGLDLIHHNPDYILIEDGANKEIISFLVDHHYKLLETIPNNCGTPKALYQTAEKQLSDTSEDVIVDNTKSGKLKGAWDIAARSNASYPGKYVAYYSLDVDGEHFSGERLWEDRWGYIGKALRDACGGDLKEKRIIELGCNLGLLSVWAAREGAICHGYEYEADILEGSKLVASAFGVSERCKWSQADFNSKAVTDKIADDFNLCTCLSVMNWVRDKDNLIDLLSRQKVVLYEGHDAEQIERERLRQAGFTDIRKIVSSERKRSVFVAGKGLPSEKVFTWDDFERQHGLKGVQYKIPHVNIGDGNQVERVYFREPEVWKARLTTEKNPAKLASPHQEAKFLQMLKDVPNVCRFKSYLETSYCTVVILEFFPNIGALNQVKIPPEFWNKVETQKHAVVNAVNDHGILHNDILDHNFLVNSNYDICLIDFDQAQLIQGLNDYEHGRYSRCLRPVVYHTAGDDKAGNLKKLEAAWDIAAKSKANSPGKYIAYYSLNSDAKFFHGEVSWSDRWKVIGEALLDACDGDFNGKHIIELGCNMGLVSIWAAKKGAVCHGYDQYADILEACKLNASAFGVSDRCKWDVMDFNSEADCNFIDYDYDVCTCLSLMNWVHNKDNLIALLSRQRAVIYEGHESDEIETGRLKSAGFSEIKKVAVSKRGRSVFLARKEKVNTLGNLNIINDRFIQTLFNSEMFKRNLQNQIQSVSLFTPKVVGPLDRLHVSKKSCSNNYYCVTTSGEIWIGDYVFFGKQVSLVTGKHDYNKFGSDRIKSYPQKGRDIIIKKGCWIATNATILGPCIIGEHAVVSAGSVVTKDVPAFAIVAGNPAKVIKHIKH